MEHKEKKAKFNPFVISLLITLLLVFVIYFPSLTREWQFFDERTFYGEGLFPIATSIAELIEIIKTYAFTYHIGSQNTFFSNIVTIRANVLGAILNMITMFLLKNNSFFYHLIQISLHLINTSLVWLVFHTIFKSGSATKNSIYFLCSIFALLWALHPANIESVLLGTNWTSLLTYAISFWLVYKILGFITANLYKLPLKTIILYTILFCTSLLISEYSYALPFIIFFLVFSLSFKQTNNIKESFKSSINMCIPFIVGIILFVSFYLFKFTFLTNTDLISNKYIDFSLERFLWLTPQIFVYFFKLFFYPNELSLYQTTYIKLADSLFSPYAVMASTLFFLFLFLPAVLFYIFKSKSKSYLLLTIYMFLFSLLPFLHIISPTYCLIAERYCYVPLFFLLLIGAFVIGEYKFFRFPKALIPALIIILIPLSTRAVTRMQDWKDTVTIFSADFKYNLSDLHKGQIHSVLVYHLNEVGDLLEMRKQSVPALISLNKALEKLKTKEVVSEPETLKRYGLDRNSLILRAAFAIADIRFNFLKEPADFVLNLYEPYIKANLDNAGTSQINIYAKLLNSTGRLDEAIKVLENAQKRYPYSPQLIYTLSNLYLETNQIKKAENIINEGYKIYPSYARMLLRKAKIAKLKNDIESQAKYQYLLGLRTHSNGNYQKAAQLYLRLNKLAKARISLQKSLYIDDKDPITLLLLSKYHQLNKDAGKIIPTLELALTNAQSRNLKLTSPEIYESILLSLISFNIEKNDKDTAQKYIIELEKLPKLSQENQAYISSVKKRLNLQ